ncbi:Panacea domain-containing protein [Dysgonomonas capnocytophagoides]|nr:type II toxin-antitoxin system antitoxin SocA domain-containing protein [Dysgonomonas capnocytophagoides]
MQKLLYMVYGIYLSTTDEKLFTDDSPKAWPFGPVFPRVNKYFTPGLIPSAADLSVSKIENNPIVFDIINSVVKQFHNKSAASLSHWSHEENGPWYKTVYDGGEAKWNKEISDILIKNYFPKHER